MGDISAARGSLPAPVVDRIAEMLRLAPVAGGVIAVAGAPDAAGPILVPFGARGPGGPPVAADDRFEIGSISKTVTALAAARLEVEGAWRLDTPVLQLLPWLRLPHGSGDPTLRHLLSHTSGWVAGNSASPGEVAQALALPASRARTAPGEYFHYSNVGYVVLGLAMAAATGRDLPALVRELVLEPLGLPGALSSITGKDRASLCPGTVPLRDDAPWSPGGPLAPAAWVEPAGADGNIAASATELLRFAQALADPPSMAAMPPWLPEAVLRISTPTAPGGEEILTLGRHLAVDSARYGLGVNIEESADGTLLTHGGGMIGYGSFMVAHPSRGLSVAVVLSGPGERPYAELLAREAHAASLPPGAGAVRAGTPDAVRSLTPSRSPLPAGSGTLAALTGHYRSYTPWCPHFEIGAASDETGRERPILRAYSGVEAPTEDTPLMRIEGGGEGALRFRVGEDPRLPETVTFGEVIDGRAQSFDLDGCLYARVVDR